MEQKEDPYRVESVDRALTLLTLLAEQGGLSVTEAGRALGVTPSTAHRLLSTLRHREFAVRAEGRRYAPGPALVGLTERDGVRPLSARVRPYLERLFDAVGETVHLMVRTGAEVHFLDGIEGRRPLRVGLRTGVRMPAARTSGGKAMLADLDPAEVDTLLATATHGEPDSAATLHGEIATVRRTHYGINHDESEPGVTALGASAGTVDGRHVALSVALPTARFATVDTDPLIAHLLEIRTDLRHTLGDGRP